MDFSYQHNNNLKDDINHFHPDYFYNGQQPIQRTGLVLNSYKMAKFIYEADNRVIYNATVGGKLELFERKDYNEVFALSNHNKNFG